MTPRESEIIELLHKEVKPALGCTEPIAVALAAARTMETLKSKARTVADYEISVEVSGNILKNGMGVGIRGQAWWASTSPPPLARSAGIAPTAWKC